MKDWCLPPSPPCWPVAAVTPKDCASWFANTQSSAGKSLGDTSPNRTCSESSARSCTALTCGKESWNSLGKPGSTCANVLYMLVTGSPLARLHSRRGGDRLVPGNCKPLSKPESYCHIRCFHGHPSQPLRFPWSSRRNAYTSSVDRLVHHHIPRLDTCTRARFLYLRVHVVQSMVQSCQDILHGMHTLRGYGLGLLMSAHE